MIFACVEKGERLRRVFFQNSKIPNLSLISAFRTFTQTTILDKYLRMTAERYAQKLARCADLKGDESSGRISEGAFLQEPLQKG